MSNECLNRNPLLRDGTSQQQRLIKALLPSYVSVDERSMSDLISFTEKLSQKIKYYDQADLNDGDWYAFFNGQVIDETTAKTNPHFALFISFLQIFKYAQEDLNTITHRHLDFYYKEVLRISEKPAVPDQVFIIFELAKQVASHLIAKETELDGGKDATGKELVYKTLKNIVVNNAQATAFKSLFYNKANDGRIYASPVADSANGVGEPIETPEPKWRTFGNITNPAASFTLADRPQASTGFAFASPVLLLSEGNRNVKITLTVSNLMGLTSADVKNAFKVFFSGEEKWIEPELSTSKMPQDVTYVGPVNSNTIIIERTLTEAQPGIVPYNAEVLADPFNTIWPVAKILLNTEDTTTPFVYQKLKSLIVNSAEVTVNVDSVKNIIVQNDQSKLDASKPFQPFGNKPLLSSSFYIGSNEIFSKKLNSLNINITWKGLPQDDNGFQGYYHDYLPVIENEKRRNHEFKAAISILDGNTWKPLVSATEDAARLFDPLPDFVSLINFSFKSTDKKLNDFRQISISNSNLKNIPAAPAMLPVEIYDNTTERGFIRLELANIDFGHSDYQVSYATQALKAAKAPVVDDYPLPNEPYTPLISEISLNYSSTEKLNLVNTSATNNEVAFTNRISQFFHVQAFGVAEAHPFNVKTDSTIKLLPYYNDEGTLYIGLDKLVVPQNLSILFKVAEGSEDPDLAKQNVKWSYLANNEWFEFPKNLILEDSTNGLINSGIITFSIPKAANKGNTILSSDKHWIKAAVTNFSRAVCDLVDIKTQAVTAIFSDQENDPLHLQVSLPAETIKDFVNSEPDIAAVIQPYASFGGRMKENSDAYYTRVSERLRHKNRAINIWDYERLVLETFPSVYKVKCLNHTRYVSASNITEISPGNVSLVIVSNLQNKNAVDPLKPKTSLTTLSAIHDLIKKINPPCADLYVRNPIYEEIVVHFNVKLMPGFDVGFYLNQLNEDIKKFLSPWTSGATDVSFGGSLHASVIINFIEEREYVDFIACFSMDQIFPSATLVNVPEAIASTAASILTSAPQHFIHVLETDDCECEDNIVKEHKGDDSCPCDEEIPLPEQNFGIGTNEVGENFIVGNGQPFGNSGVGSMEIENNFDVE